MDSCEKLQKPYVYKTHTHMKCSGDSHLLSCRKNFSTVVARSSEVSCSSTTGTTWFQVSWMAKTHCYGCYFSALQSLDWDSLPTQKLAIFGIPQNWRNIRIWLFLLLAFQSDINSQCPQTTSWGSYSIPRKVCWKKGWVKVTTFLSYYY